MRSGRCSAGFFKVRKRFPYSGKTAGRRFKAYLRKKKGW